jgi:hypothetical protein
MANIIDLEKGKFADDGSIKVDSSFLPQTTDGIKIDWSTFPNLQGPTGATGPAGPTGATGATGPTGPAGSTPGYSFAINSTAPNNTITAAVATATDTATDVDVVISPKGNGAWSLQVADNTTTGGNKRGTNAVDLQAGARTLNTQVASGANSFVVGLRNTASGNQSNAQGLGSTASNAVAFALGNGVNSTGNSSFATGNSTTASGASSFASGFGSNTFSVIGRYSHAGNLLAASGDSQYSRFGLRNSTTNATATRLSVDAAAASATNQAVLQNNNAFYFKGEIVAKQTASTNVAVWTFSGVIVRGTSAATTVLVGTPTITAITNVPAWGTPTITADTTLGCINVTVTGLAATSIRWNCNLETTEIIYT